MKHEHHIFKFIMYFLAKSQININISKLQIYFKKNYVFLTHNTSYILLKIRSKKGKFHFQFYFFHDFGEIYYKFFQNLVFIESDFILTNTSKANFYTR